MPTLACARINPSAVLGRWPSRFGGKLPESGRRPSLPVTMPSAAPPVGATIAVLGAASEARCSSVRWRHDTAGSSTSHSGRLHDCCLGRSQQGSTARFSRSGSGWRHSRRWGVQVDLGEAQHLLPWAQPCGSVQVSIRMAPRSPLGRPSRPPGGAASAALGAANKAALRERKASPLPVW